MFKMINFSCELSNTGLTECSGVHVYEVMVLYSGWDGQNIVHTLYHKNVLKFKWENDEENV